jgi:hypothetical protein
MSGFDMGNFDITSDIESGDIDSAPVPANNGYVDTASRGAEVVTPKDAVRLENAPQPKPDDTRKSLRDQIAAAVKGEAPADPQAAPQTPAGDRPRNPDGTFAQAAPADPQAPSSAPVAPAGVPPELAPQFAQLPPEMQQFVARTLEGANTPQNTHVAEIEQVLAPRMQAFALQGQSPGQVVSQLFALSDFAEKDPAGFIRYFSQNRGIDLEDIVFGDDGEQTPQQSPEYLELQQQLQQVQQQLNVREQQEAQARQAETANRIVSFFDAKDDGGAPLRPYADDVGGVILPYIQMVREQQPNMSMEQVLQEAYDRACWATPEVRAKLQQRTTEASQADQMRKQQERVLSKQNASSSMAPTVPNNPRTPDNGKSGGNLRDTIRQAMSSQ